MTTDQARVYFVNVGLIINRWNFLSFPVLYPRYHVIIFGIVGRRCWTVCSAPYKTQPPEIFIKIDGRQDIEIHRFRNIFYNEWEVPWIAIQSSDETRISHDLNVWICFCFQVVHLPGVGCTQEASQVHIIRPPIHAMGGGIAHGSFQYRVVTEWNWSFTHLTWGHVGTISCRFVTALQVTVLRLAPILVITQYAPFTPLAHHCGSGSMHTDTDMRVKGSTLPTQRFLLTVSITEQTVKVNCTGTVGFLWEQWWSLIDCYKERFRNWSNQNGEENTINSYSDTWIFYTDCPE